MTPVRDHTIVYGGSYDPPHVGHQLACLYLLEALRAGEVWLVPTLQHVFDKQLTPFEHRFAMCELMARPFAGRVVVSRVEAERGGTSRTYDTLVGLRAAFPERRFALAVGADIPAETSKWYRWDDIVAMVPVIVLGRQGYTDPQALPVALPEVSSTEIRGRVRTGLSIEGLVPSAVADYIAEHGLYLAPTNGG